MDARDIKTHVSNLDKALKEKAPAATIIDILSSLKKGVVATESVLRVRMMYSGHGMFVLCFALLCLLSLSLPSPCIVCRSPFKSAGL